MRERSRAKVTDQMVPVFSIAMRIASNIVEDPDGQDDIYERLRHPAIWELIDVQLREELSRA